MEKNALNILNKGLEKLLKMVLTLVDDERPMCEGFSRMQTCFCGTRLPPKNEFCRQRGLSELGLALLDNYIEGVGS